MISLTLFLSSSITLPIVQMLQQKSLLAGVVITPRMDADSANLENQIQQMQIPVVRYDTGNITDTVIKMKAFGGNIGLVVTFSVKLPLAVIDSFEYGMFNVHASLLPLYRGACPLFWQLRNSEKEGAVVIHKIEEKIDCGDIVLTYKFDIHPLDTYGVLSGVVFQIIPILIQELLELFEKNPRDIPCRKQEGKSSKAPFPKREDFLVDWRTMTAQEIAALARAGNPVFGGAYFFWKGGYIGIMEAKSIQMETFGVKPGVILQIGEPEGFLIVTKEGTLKIDVVSMGDGVFSGLNFSDRFSLKAGEDLNVR